MKKKETPKQKPKEFAATPFKGLKGVALELRDTVVAPPPPKKPQANTQGPDDETLFLNAFADVRPLHPVNAAPFRAKAQAAKSQKTDDDQRVFLQAVEALKMDVRFSDELPEQEAPPLPASVNRLRQLRRGGIRIDLQLDLHGLTKDEAIESLDRFVKGAYNRGQKGVLVITGKGLNSPGEPVLKLAVAGWLKDKGKAMISEFVAAPRDMGGSGAFVVFLKEKKPQDQANP